MIKNIDLFEKAPVPKAVLKLAVPTVLSMIVTVLYNMVDAFFVGLINDPSQFAAVNVATPVFMFLMAAGNIFGMGGSSFLSRALGEKKMDKVKSIFKRIIFGAIVLSIASLLFMMFAGRYVAPLFIKPTDTELLSVSIVGMQLFSLSYLTGWVDMCFSSYFTALERPVRSLMTSFFGTLVFPIAFLFILSPIWNLNGVWLSPLFSCSASAVFTMKKPSASFIA